MKDLFFVFVLYNIVVVVVVRVKDKMCERWSKKFSPFVNVVVVVVVFVHGSVQLLNNIMSRGV